MASHLLRAARGQLAFSERAAGRMAGLRVMTTSGRVLSDEEKAAENVYFKKLEHEQLEKLHAQLEEHKEAATTAQAKAEEAIEAAKRAHAKAEEAHASSTGGSQASGALYALGGVAVGILGMYLLGPK